MIGFYVLITCGTIIDSIFRARYEVLRFIFKDGAVILKRLILKESCDRLKVQLNKKVARDFVKTVTSLRASYSSDVTVTAVLKRSSRQHKGHVASETENQCACHRRWAWKRALSKQRRPDKLSRHGEMFYSESEVAILGIRLIPTQVFNRLGIQINWPCSNREFT